jgi:hypothetical protein
MYAIFHQNRIVESRFPSWDDAEAALFDMLVSGVSGQVQDYYVDKAS